MMKISNIKHLVFVRNTRHFLPVWHGLFSFFQTPSTLYITCLTPGMICVPVISCSRWSTTRGHRPHYLFFTSPQTLDLGHSYIQHVFFHKGLTHPWWWKTYNRVSHRIFLDSKLQSPISSFKRLLVHQNST